MEWNVIVGVICTVLGAVIGYATFSRGKSKNDQEEGERIGAVMTELGYIKANTEEIKSEQKRQRDVNLDFAVRLSEVEASAKSAHKRIDRIEGAPER